MEILYQYYILEIENTYDSDRNKDLAQINCHSEILTNHLKGFYLDFQRMTKIYLKLDVKETI